MLKQKKRRAVVVTDSYIEYFGIEKALEMNNYRAENLKKDGDTDLRARLIVYVLDKMDGFFLYVCRQNHSEIIPAPMIVILKNKKDFRRLDLKKLSIDACIAYDDDISELHEAIYKLNQGQKYISGSLQNYKRDDFLDKLTRRQYEICALTAQGKTTKEIAEALDISEKTIRNQISLINKSIAPKTFYQAVIEYLNQSI